MIESTTDNPMSTNQILSNSYLNPNDSNKWNEHYAAAANYYNTDYYRNFQYSQTQTNNATNTSNFNHFHPPAYWLHHHESANNSNWSPRSASSGNVLNNNSSYYPNLPISLNTANLTASSLSSSASSSTNTTPQSSVLSNNAKSLENSNYHSTPASSSFDPRMHSQLVNAYQYNFSNLHHYPHYNHNANMSNNYFYPSTPPKDLSISDLNKAKTNSNNSSLNDQQSDSLSLKNEASLISPTAAEDLNEMRSFKKIKLDSDAEKLKKNIKDLNESEEDYDEDDDELNNSNSLEAGDEEDDEEDSGESSMHHYKHDNLNMWQQMNPNQEQFIDYKEQSLDENNLKWSPNSTKNSKKKQALPGN